MHVLINLGLTPEYKLKNPSSLMVFDKQWKKPQ